MPWIRAAVPIHRIFFMLSNTSSRRSRRSHRQEVSFAFRFRSVRYSSPEARSLSAWSGISSPRLGKDTTKDKGSSPVGRKGCTIT